VKYNKIKALFEADLIDSFKRTRNHGVRWKGLSLEGALDEVDFSVPSKERTGALHQEVNYMVAHLLHHFSRFFYLFKTKTMDRGFNFMNLRVNTVNSRTPT
jgi:hypothetical protein